MKHGSLVNQKQIYIDLPAAFPGPAPGRDSGVDGTDCWGFSLDTGNDASLSFTWWTFFWLHKQKESSPRSVSCEGFLPEGSVLGCPGLGREAKLTGKASMELSAYDIPHVHGIASSSIEIHDPDFQLPRGPQLLSHESHISVAFPRSHSQSIVNESQSSKPEMRRSQEQLNLPLSRSKDSTSENPFQVENCTTTQGVL